MPNAFMTMHDANHNPDDYLYHYCSFETATKIICNNNLRFSKIYNLNDTTEYKPKIIFSKDSPDNDQVLECCRQINRCVKICCFTQDNKRTTRLTKNDNRYFTDYTGRGFAFPRMWAQYAKNNKGVCLIINKKNLEAALDSQLTILFKGAIEYRERYKCFRFTSKILADFKKQVLNRNTTDSIAATKFFQNYPAYVSENFFTKLLDWKDENEYRIALFSPEGEDLRLNNLTSFLEGIVIGENIDTTDEAILKKLLRNNVPIKKIHFENRNIILQ